MQYAALVSGDIEEYVSRKMGTAIPTRTYLPLSFTKLKTKVHPTTDHQGPEESRGITLLFL
jgi:hypothetical protein